MATTSISNMIIASPVQPSNNNYTPKLHQSSSLTLNTPTLTITRKPTSTACKAINTNTTISQEQQQRRPTSPKLEQADISSVWRKLHGEDNWAGLLDPIDPRMRAELIRYGEMVQACYDSFDYDPYSKYCGSCRYPPEELFEALDLGHLGYTVSRYFYATANINIPSFFKRSRWPHRMWSERANWAGYVAVSDDETSRKLGRRDVAIVWRGTVTHTEWVADLENYLRSISPEIPCPDGRDVKVEAGFLDLYTDKEPNCRFCKYSARQQLLTEVKRLVEKYQEEEVSITITGHSLGSAIALLSAFDIAHTGLNARKDGTRVHVSAMTFAGPRVGNLRFKERLERELGVKVLRVHNIHDLVPKSPGFLINENSAPWLLNVAQGLPWSYTHVGVDLALDHKKSPHLNTDRGTYCAHNLEAYLHLLDGYHGSNLRFESATGRDVALVNKSCDFVTDEHSVPPVWWQDLNKGLVRGPDGRWVQEERPKFVDHPEDIEHHIKQLGI